MAENIATSFGSLNYSGMLFAKGRVDTPFSSMIGAKRRFVNHVEFAVGVEYNVGEGEIPAYSENASLEAPKAKTVTRGQKTNVTQIFMDSFGVSDAKESNMGTLAGLNVAGQQANPMSEIDFQAGVTMQRVAKSIEKTFIQGSYNKATTDDEVNSTRGIVNAIETNVMDLGGKAISIWDVADMLRMIHDAGGSTTGLVLWCDSVTKFQFSAEAAANGFTVINQSREVNGLHITRIETPAGAVELYEGVYLPEGTALLLNFDVIAPVEQPHPQKGNFYLKELPTRGFGTEYALFGQVGLDHGPEWMHGKFVNIKTTYDRPTGLLVNTGSASEETPTVTD